MHIPGLGGDPGIMWDSLAPSTVTCRGIPTKTPSGVLPGPYVGGLWECVQHTSRVPSDPSALRPTHSRQGHFIAECSQQGLEAEYATSRGGGTVPSLPLPLDVAG